MRGRPTRSSIRQNIVELLFYLSPAHGYDVYHKYLEIFPSVTQRSIYYHLKKGLETEEFQIKEIRKEAGNFSWGGFTERTYYKLGSAANVLGNDEVKEYFKTKYKSKD